MNGRRAFIVAIGAQLSFAGAFLIAGAVTGWHGVAQAEPPVCDRVDVTECSWTIDVDGRQFDVVGCANEDGNVDGRPCLWRDSDTGAMFYVTSQNYR